MSASDWIGIGIIVLVIAGGLLLLNQITKPYDVKNEEEFQKRRKEGGLLSAGMMGLQQLLDPSARKAAEVQEDLRRGNRQLLSAERHRGRRESDSARNRWRRPRDW